MEKRKNIGAFFDRKSVFFRWFLSYLMMLILALLASMAIYFYAFRVIDKQQKNTNEIMLEKIETEIEDYFDTVKKTAASLMIDSDVEKLIRKEEFNISDRITIYNIYKKIQNKKLFYSFIDRIFIYFKQSDTVLFDDGHVDKNLFYELYYQTEEFSAEEFGHMINRGWWGEFISAKNRNKEDMLFYLRNSSPRGEESAEATFGICISSDEIIRVIESQKWQESTEVVILDEDNIICSNGVLGEVLLEEYAYAETDFREYTQINVAGERYHIIANQTSENGYTYIALTPVKAVHQEAQKIQRFTMVLMLICATIGIAFSYMMAGFHYHPLRELMDFYGGFQWKKGDIDEYQWLKGKTAQNIKENWNIKKLYYEKKNALRHEYLYRLVALPYDGKVLEEEMLFQDVFLQRGNYLVGLFYLNYLSEEAMRKAMDRNLIRFILNNILEELTEERIKTEVVDMTDCYAVIVNSDMSLPEIREVTEEVVEQLQKFLASKLGVDLMAVFGTLEKELMGINQSYMFARETSEYRKEISKDSFIWYEDIRNRHTIYQYSAETAQKIIYAIHSGQMENAYTWTKDVITTNYCERRIAGFMKNCLVAELTGTIIKGAEQAGGTEYILNYMEKHPVPQYYQKEEVLTYFHAFIRDVCENISYNGRAKRDNRQFSVQVMDYVKENYQNPDLNISITALHFKITPSYLSALFKEQTGQGLLDYINRMRIERVKELLMENYSLNEICEQTGFRSSGAMIRVFKKITGITPGQMKNMLGK